MFNIFTALRRLCNSLNTLADTLDGCNDRLTQAVGYTPAPVDVTPEPLPAPDAAPEPANGEARRKAKARG